MAEAARHLWDLSWDERTGMLEEAREKQLMDERTRMATAYLEGHEGGLWLGIKEARRGEKYKEGVESDVEVERAKVARKCLAVGMSREDVLKATGLFAEDLEVWSRLIQQCRPTDKKLKEQVDEGLRTEVTDETRLTAEEVEKKEMARKEARMEIAGKLLAMGVDREKVRMATSLYDWELKELKDPKRPKAPKRGPRRKPH